jgi:TonB family protein
MKSGHYHTSLGWITSFCLHALLGVFLFLYHFYPTIPSTKYIEISLGTLSGGEGGLPKFAIPQQGNPETDDAEVTTNLNNPIALQERKYFSLNEEIIRLPSTKKTINADATMPLTLSNKTVPDRDEKRSSNFFSTSTEKKGSPSGSVSGNANNNGIAPGNGGTGKGGFGSGDGVGEGVSYGVQWMNGISRRRTGGEVPMYPPDVNMSAQIKLRVVVLPNGNVKSATPLQKGNTRLENAAMNKVKFWRFEPLLSAQPQVEQICDITFNFELK